MIGAGRHMEFDRDAERHQPTGEVDILLQEQVERANADEGGRQVGQVAWQALPPHSSGKAGSTPKRC